MNKMNSLKKGIQKQWKKEWSVWKSGKKKQRKMRERERKILTIKGQKYV